jgi:hypothetical protein
MPAMMGTNTGHKNDGKIFDIFEKFSLGMRKEEIEGVMESESSCDDPI